MKISVTAADLPGKAWLLSETYRAAGATAATTIVVDPSKMPDPIAAVTAAVTLGLKLSGA